MQLLKKLSRPTTISAACAWCTASMLERETLACLLEDRGKVVAQVDAETGSGTSVRHGAESRRRVLLSDTLKYA
jgi:hypothetical protein